MLNGSFLLLVQNLPGPKQPSHSESWLDNGSIVDIPLNGSILRWARLKLITGTCCTRIIIYNGHREIGLVLAGHYFLKLYLVMAI